MSVSLVEFLKNGRLGPIGPGDVFKLDSTVLGEPDGESEYFGDRILKFGDLQVSVSKGIITALSIHLRDEPCEFPPGLGVTDFTITETTSFCKFLDFLCNNEIDWNVDTYFSERRWICIRIRGHIRADFDLETPQRFDGLISESVKSDSNMPS